MLEWRDIMAQPDMRGKVCMVTGGSSGLGKATALGLAQLGATVVMACRDRDRGEAARAEIVRKSGNDQVDVLLADLSAQRSIRRLADEFRERYQALHVLVNNAGGVLSHRVVTEDGLETTFAVNHLAYFLLTNLLLDVLKASAPARIVNVSSGAGRTPLNRGGAIVVRRDRMRHTQPSRVQSTRSGEQAAWIPSLNSAPIPTAATGDSGGRAT
jgi:NAD(P)-dependent dehydrogenase (short-subunit alcohol dehydrogenase family)